MPETTTKPISKVTRLAGALLAETNGEYYLVGELKEPCHFEEQGFEKPPEFDPDHPIKFRKLKKVREITVDSEYLEMETQGEALAELLWKRFVIPRNHSVSERLWRIATIEKKGNGVTDARWLEQMPDEVWDTIREGVLKCL